MIVFIENRHKEAKVVKPNFTRKLIVTKLPEYGASAEVAGNGRRCRDLRGSPHQWLIKKVVF